MHLSVTPDMCVESSPTPPPCGDCAMGRETKHCSLTPSVEQRRSMPGREENRMMGGKKATITQLHHNFKRKAKHAEVKINGQTEGKRVVLSLLLVCHSFTHLLSLKVKVKMTFPFHTSPRTSFAARTVDFCQQGVRPKGI